MPTDDGRRTSPAATRLAATGIGMVGIALWASETSLARATGALPLFEIVALAFAAASLLSPLAWWITGESPALAFRQRPAVWLITVPSLVCYHACIYFCVHRVPAAPAALLQGCTPLMIVLGSALLPGQRLRWWHVAGVVAGLEGLVSLSAEGRGFAVFTEGGAPPYLALIGLAAGLWGLYSLVSSRFGSVPTSAMGMFYAASSLVAFVCHGLFETWVTPTPGEASAIVGLGLLPMGAALYFWDYGLKKGDIQALGVGSYVEPLIGAGLVVLFGQGQLEWSMLVSGFVIVGGAILGSVDAFDEAASPRYEARSKNEMSAGPAHGAALDALPPRLRLWVLHIAAHRGVPPAEVVRRCVEIVLAESLKGEAWRSRQAYLAHVDALIAGGGITNGQRTRRI